MSATATDYGPPLATSPTSGTPDVVHIMDTIATETNHLWEPLCVHRCHTDDTIVLSQPRAANAISDDQSHLLQHLRRSSHLRVLKVLFRDRRKKVPPPKVLKDEEEEANLTVKFWNMIKRTLITHLRKQISYFAVGSCYPL